HNQLALRNAAVILLGPFYTTLGWRGSRFELSNTAENAVIKGVNRRAAILPTRLFDLCHVVIWRESMSPVPRAEVSEVLPALQQEIARLAGLPEIRLAFAWLRLQEAQFSAWQLEMARITALLFGEWARGGWLAQYIIGIVIE